MIKRTLTTAEIAALDNKYFVYSYGTSTLKYKTMVSPDSVIIGFDNLPDVEVRIQFEKASLNDVNFIHAFLYEHGNVIVSACPASYNSMWMDGDDNPQNSLHEIICTLLGIYATMQRITEKRNELARMMSSIGASC